MPDSVIVDTSSLIALEKIGLLNLLCDLYSEVLVPESVMREYGPIGLPCLSVRRVVSNLYMGLKITGTIGVLLRAERSGLIESAEKKVRELKTKGFYISDELLEGMARLRR
jgi:predicted nucleic acid-binding protein